MARALLCLVSVWMLAGPARAQEPWMGDEARIATELGVAYLGAGAGVALGLGASCTQTMLGDGADCWEVGPDAPMWSGLVLAPLSLSAAVHTVGTILGGHGSFAWTLAGSLLGSVVPLVLGLTANGSEDILPVVATTLILPQLGAVLGFELSNGTDPPSAFERIGRRLSFAISGAGLLLATSMFAVCVDGLAGGDCPTGRHVAATVFAVPTGAALSAWLAGPIRDVRTLTGSLIGSAAGALFGFGLSLRLAPHGRWPAPQLSLLLPTIAGSVFGAELGSSSGDSDREIPVSPTLQVVDGGFVAGAAGTV